MPRTIQPRTRTSVHPRVHAKPTKINHISVATIEERSSRPGANTLLKESSPGGADMVNTDARAMPTASADKQPVMKSKILKIFLVALRADMTQAV